MMIYFLKVSISWLVFILLYLVLLRRFTFLNLNRFYLLFTLLVSLSLPQIQMNFATQDQAVLHEVIVPLTSQMHLAETQITNTIIKNNTQTNYYFLIYCLGSVFFSLLFMRGIIYILQLYRNGEKEIQEGYTIVTLKNPLPAFSFHKWIFISEQERTSSDFESILEHELCHVKQNHTLDIILVEIVKIIFWCSPVIYFYKNAIKELHEFIADNAAIKKINTKEYGQLLLGYKSHTKVPALTNPIFHSHLKTRIKMMLRKRTSKYASMHYALALPIIFLMLLAFSGNEEKLVEKIEDISKATEWVSKSNGIEENNLTIPKEAEEADTKGVEPAQTNPNPNSSTINSKCHKIRDKDFYMVFDHPATIESCGHLTGEDRSKCARETLSQYFTAQDVYTEEALKEGYQGYLAWTIVINEKGEMERVERAKNLAKKNSFGLFEKGDNIIEEFKDQFSFVAAECNGEKVKSYIIFSHKYILTPDQIARVERGTNAPFQKVTLMNASSKGGLGFEYRSNFKTPYTIRVLNPSMEEVHTEQGEYMYSATRGYVTMENPVNGTYTVVASQDGKEVRNTLEVNVFSN